MKQFKKLMVFMLAALMVFGTIKYTPIYAEDAVAKEEGVFDTVTFEGKKDITIHAGKPFTFTQKIKKENEINTGEEEIIPETENASQEKKKPIVTVKATREGDSAKYRAIVSEVKTPEGGNFVYHEGDTTFMPAEAEVGKEYVITYQAETSIDDGKTWQEVPDAKYEVHIKIAEKEEQTTESEEQLTPEESEDEHNQENLQITADDIVFHGENEKTISIGTNYNFYDMNNIYASGPSDHHELYAITVNKIETPEGGSYVYQNGDQQFTPTKDDSNLDYTITYGVSVSIDDGTTWHKVDNAEFITKLHIAKAETTRSARRRRSVPIYAGMISQFKINTADEYLTGQAVSTNVSVAINGTSTVDEAFYVEIVMPKDGIYGTNPTESKYRLQISEYSKALESTMSEDANNYIMSYKLMPGSQAQVFSVPLNFKFIRTGLVPDGAQYTISARVKTLNGDIVRTDTQTMTLRYNTPSSARLEVETGDVLKRDSIMLNDDATALVTDTSKLRDVVVKLKINMLRNPTDTQSDVIGIRNISRIVDTFTLPSIAHVDTSSLPQGVTYNPSNHTLTRVYTNTFDWFDGMPKYEYLPGGGNILTGVVRFSAPGAIIGQTYPITLKREYQFDNDPASNVTLNASGNFTYMVSNYKYLPSLEVIRKQTGDFSMASNGSYWYSYYYDNLVPWNGNPMTEMDVYRSLITDDPNPTSRITLEPIDGLEITNNEKDENLDYDSILINPDSDNRPTTFNGTLKVVGVKYDDTETIIADNIVYQQGSCTTIPIVDNYKSVKVVANSGSTLETVCRKDSPSFEPGSYSKQGLKVRFQYKFANGLDGNKPYIFKGRMDFKKPSSLSDPVTFLDYGRGYEYKGDYTYQLNPDKYGAGFKDRTDYPYAFSYLPSLNVRNKIGTYSSGTTSVSGTGNRLGSQIGDVFQVSAHFTKYISATDPLMRNGKLQFTLPLGYELVDGQETITLGTNGTFSKDAASILASKSGPFTDANHRTYYIYDLGDVNVQGGTWGQNTICIFSAKIKHVAYNPEVLEDDNRRYAYMYLKFDDQQGETLNVINSTTGINSYNSNYFHSTWDDLFKIHKFTRSSNSDYERNKYIVAAERKNISYGIGTSLYADYTGEDRSGRNEGFLFTDAKNKLSLASTRLTGFSGSDYINNIIDLEVKVYSYATLADTYTSSILNLNLPDGLEIVPGSETLTDNNGNFSSDKSISDIISSRDGDVYDFGKTSMVTNKPWDLTLRLKVKVTDKMVANQVIFSPVMKIKSNLGIIVSKETIDPNNPTAWARSFKYVPATGLYSALTGMGVTRKSYVQNDGKVKYEINVGNYTGDTIRNISVISYIPEVGDIDTNGNPRNTELTPILKSIVGSSDYRVFISKDKPIPGLTVSEYDGVANWESVGNVLSGSSLDGVKAVKFVRTGNVTHGTQNQVAEIEMYLKPEDIKKENSGKVINNDFAVRYTIGTLDTNYVSSNVKQYEYKSIVVKGRAFIDYNLNGIYDEGDEICNDYIYGKIYQNDIETSNVTFNQYYSPINSRQIGYFTTFLFQDEGQYKFVIQPPYDYKLAPYGPGENESNIHPETLSSDTYNLSFDGRDEVFINIGLQPASNTYVIKYDLNGGHMSGNNKTFYYKKYYVSSGDPTIDGASPNLISRPYHTLNNVWNTEPDGSGTSYTGNQIANGFSRVPGSVTTLYLQWTPITNYTVRYNRSGPDNIITGTMSDDAVTVGTGYTLKHNGFTNPNGTFAGWKLKDGTSFYEGEYVTNLWDGNLIDPDTQMPITQPVVIDVYANWSQPLYTFKADSDGYQPWGSSVIENPDHPFDPSDPYHMDPSKSHPRNYAAANPVVGAKFRLNKINPDGSEGDFVASATSKEKGQLYFENVSIGEYYLTEEVTPNGYVQPAGKWKVKVAIDNFTGDSVLTKEGGIGNGYDTRTNSTMLELAYYPYFGKSMNSCILNEGKFYHNVSLSTRISDENFEFASINQNYRYKLTFLDRYFNPIKNATFTYVGETIPGITNAHSAPPNGTLTTDENGVAYMTLKHGQRIQIKDVLNNTKISILQLTEGGDIYTQIDSSGFAFNPGRATAVKVLGKNGSDIAVDYKIMNFSPVPTGIHHMNNKSILLGVGVIVFLMLVAYSVYIRKRRYHRMNLSEDRDIYASRMVPKGVKVDAYQEDQTEIKPPVGGPSPGIRNPHHRSRDSTDLQLPIWMVSDTG